MKLETYFQYRTRNGDLVEDLQPLNDSVTPFFSPSTGLCYTPEGRTMLGKDNTTPDDLVERLPFFFGELPETEQLYMQLAYYRDKKTIQIFDLNHSWETTDYPSFSLGNVYRIKPKPKVQPQIITVTTPQGLTFSYWHTDGVIDVSTINWEIV